MNANAGAAERPILEVKNIKKHFPIRAGFFGGTTGYVYAVDGVSFDIAKGETLSLVGESGCGKSTVGKAVLRLFPLTDGEVWLRGERIDNLSPHRLRALRRHMQVIFQDPFSSLNPRMRVRDIIAEPIINFGLAKNSSELDDRVAALIDKVQLPRDAMNRFPHEFSGGQRQRVAIARALAVEPKVILADEPVSMLDVSIRMGILNLMAQLRDEQNIAFLYVTHDIASARYFADETLVMYAGHVVEGGDSERLIMDPKHPYTQLLLSAVPNPARGLRTAATEDKGEVPDLRQVGHGCPFAPRCKHVMDVCRQAMPPVTQLSPDRWTRCYLYEDAGERNPALTPAPERAPRQEQGQSG